MTDVNEHPPIFSSPFYRGTIYHDDSEILLGADDTDERVVVTVQATDLDYGINAKISYSITAGTLLNYFQRKIETDFINK